MKQKTLCLALAALLLLALPLPARAADPSYSGPLDPRTGLPQGEGAVQDENGRTALSDTMFYDWTTHDYVYPITDTLSEVHSSAADGMVLTVPVSVSSSGDVPVTVYWNGSPYTGLYSSINSVGDYVVSATVNGQTRQILTFSLVGATTSGIHTFLAPAGFYILDATRDGEPIYGDRYSVSMEPEGNYSIQYECSATDLIYRLETYVDRTPPNLTFEGKPDREGRLRSALYFYGLQAGDSISLRRSGEPVGLTLNEDGVSGVISSPGNYVMLVSDSAGNTVEYDFIILQYLNMQGWVFFLLVFASLGGVVLYVYIKRKRLKIG